MFQCELNNPKGVYAFEHCDRFEPRDDLPIQVIRCRDCVWFDAWLTTGGECNGMADGGYVPEDGYCHNAERKK